MACYHLLTAYRSSDGLITFDKGKACSLPFFLPCGQCVGCRLERSRQWAVRCVHEASLHDDNCFITLTYDDDHLPDNGSLRMDHFQDFMKRFRKRIYPRKIRFFHCGEYGEELLRPHYHACIFGFDFPDKVLFKCVDGVRLYRSALLESLWQNRGFCTVGDVTFESAAYVARYVMKKVTGDGAFEAYTRVLDSTGEVVTVSPEYVTMSRRPGIGAGWFDEYGSEVSDHGTIVIRGREMRPPRFYDKLLESADEERFEELKRERRQAAADNWRENTEERLAVREKVKKAQVSMLKRSVE